MRGREYCIRGMQYAVLLYSTLSHERSPPTILRFYRFQTPGEKRWHTTRHRMSEADAPDWFAKFKPRAKFEPVEHGRTEVTPGEMAPASSFPPVRNEYTD